MTRRQLRETAYSATSDEQRSFDELYGDDADKLFEGDDGLIDPRFKKLFESVYGGKQPNYKALRESCDLGPGINDCAHNPDLEPSGGSDPEVTQSEQDYDDNNTKLFEAMRREPGEEFWDKAQDPDEDFDSTLQDMKKGRWEEDDEEYTEQDDFEDSMSSLDDIEEDDDDDDDFGDRDGMSWDDHEPDYDESDDFEDEGFDDDEEEDDWDELDWENMSEEEEDDVVDQVNAQLDAELEDESEGVSHFDKSEMDDWDEEDDDFSEDEMADANGFNDKDREFWAKKKGR